MTTSANDKEPDIMKNSYHIKEGAQYIIIKRHHIKKP